VQQILENCNEFSIETHHLFIDFKAVYDSVDRFNLYIAMKEVQIPKKLIALVLTTLKNSKCEIKIQNNLSKPMEIRNGLQQGDALACLLFNIALEKVIRDANIHTKGTIFYKSVQILTYADVIVIIARTETAIKEAFTNLEKTTKKMHLNIN
jgi:sorting nexin-29